jgi:NitT/TauT family transport system substrate-binding protein
MIGRRGFLGGLTAPLVALLAPVAGIADDLGTIRVGVLQFGTVNWELDVIEHHGLDHKHGFTLVVQGFGSDQATDVALQGGAVDAIVSDWLWVSRQRAAGQMLTFVPFSSAVGALMVARDSGIESVRDLAGKRIGIAGGPLDKSWLLLQALAAREGGPELLAGAELVYGAPPLLNQRAEAGALEAVLNYWHFAARLEARGFRRLIDVEQIARELGIEHEVPQLGYVFHENWANENAELALAFVAASREAKQILLRSDQEWQRLRPLIKAEDDATFEVLKRRWRDGVPESFGEAERASAAALFRLLADLGGERLVGPAPELQPGTFWSEVTF